MDGLSVQKIGQNISQNIQRVEIHRVEETEGFEAPEDIVQEELEARTIDVKA